MRIGFAVPTSGSWATRRNIVEVSRRAEELRYHSLWTFQRLLYPEGADWAPVYRSVQDPIVTLAHVAAITARARLGLAVVNAPFYAPILLAKQLATLDQLSDGRLDTGLGLGWAPPEFEAVGVPYERRGARVEEYVRCLRTLWTDDVVRFEGGFYTIPPSHVDPKPVQRPAPPLLLGGTARPALRRAGRIADGWISSSRADLVHIGESIDVVRAAAADAGRDPATLRFVVRGVVQVRDRGAAERTPLTGSVDEIRSDLPLIESQGATELFVDLNFDPQIGSPSADPPESMRRAAEVLEAFAPAAG
jgi:probable F420-dependent oxidoreductase